MLHRSLREPHQHRNLDSMAVTFNFIDSSSCILHQTAVLLFACLFWKFENHGADRGFAARARRCRTPVHGRHFEGHCLGLVSGSLSSLRSISRIKSIFEEKANTGPINSGNRNGYELGSRNAKGSANGPS